MTCICGFVDAVFGCALEDQFDPGDTSAPPVVVKCVHELEERAAQQSEYLSSVSFRRTHPKIY